METSLSYLGPHILNIEGTIFLDMKKTIKVFENFYLYKFYFSFQILRSANPMNNPPIFKAYADKYTEYLVQLFIDFNMFNIILFFNIKT